MRSEYAIVVLLLGATGVRAATYFVAPGGNDLNSGAIDAPFSNITKAVSLVGQASTDLSSWTGINTEAPVTGGQQFFDADGTNQPQRFYRIDEQ